MFLFCEKNIMNIQILLRPTVLSCNVFMSRINSAVWTLRNGSFICLNRMSRWYSVMLWIIFSCRMCVGLMGGGRWWRVMASIWHWGILSFDDVTWRLKGRPSFFSPVFSRGNRPTHGNVFNRTCVRLLPVKGSKVPLPAVVDDGCCLQIRAVEKKNRGLDGLRLMMSFIRDSWSLAGGAGAPSNAK